MLALPGEKCTPISRWASHGARERKAMSMALVDRALRAQELGEEIAAPAQMPEFVLYHADNVEASGFVQHLKLPHYVDFQSELNLVRALRKQATDNKSAESKALASSDRVDPVYPTTIAHAVQKAT